MRPALLSLALLLAISSGATADDGPAAAVRTAIIDVIQSQLDAFQRDDGVEAFSYASPGIRDKFGTVENFMSMVRTGYPAVYRPQAVQFLDARASGATIGQAVRFIDQHGRAVVALYTMEQQPDGTWRIAGVQLIPVDGQVS